MAGGEPRLGTTATYMRHNDHGTTHLSTEIDILHDLINDEYRVFSEGSVRKWSKFGLRSVGYRYDLFRVMKRTNVRCQARNLQLRRASPGNAARDETL